MQAGNNRRQILRENCATYNLSVLYIPLFNHEPPCFCLATRLNLIQQMLNDAIRINPFRFAFKAKDETMPQAW